VSGRTRVAAPADTGVGPYWGMNSRSTQCPPRGRHMGRPLLGHEQQVDPVGADPRVRPGADTWVGPYWGMNSRSTQ